MKTYIRVRLIHEGIELFHRLPDTHAGTTTALEVDASLDIEGNSLLFCGYEESEIGDGRNQTVGPRFRTMLLLIEVLDTIAGIFVLTEVCLVLLRIELRIIIPQFQFLDVHCVGMVRLVTKDVDLSKRCTDLHRQRRRPRQRRGHHASGWQYG